MKVVTVVGTRPEIIRLSQVIKLLDRTVDHVLVHTGQNYDYTLNQVFFDDLGLREPDHFLGIDISSLGQILGQVLSRTEEVLLEEKPDAFLVLGDTNSCIAAIMAKRMRIPVYHMEAGNRCFDENVPEETNRRIIDHTADFNLAYTEHARRNLLAEGLHPRRMIVTGSPMREVLNAQKAAIDASDVLARLDLEAGKYFVVSAHRQENVDSPDRLNALLDCLEAVAGEHEMPLLVSTHPRTRQKLDKLGRDVNPLIRWHEPLGFNDYNHLQLHSFATLSDSGTISEESSILGFPAVTLRDSIERPEALDTGAIIMTGLMPEVVLAGIELARADSHAEMPGGYEVENTAHRTVSFIMSTYAQSARWYGLRTGSQS